MKGSASPSLSKAETPAFLAEFWIQTHSPSLINTMAKLDKSTLSKEYISDSGSDEEVEYQPPKHYHKVKPASLPKDKELWLIKAPKGFDFSSLKTLPISFNPLESSDVFDLKGVNYVVQEDLTDINMNNDSASNKYKVLAKEMKEIKRFYNIQQRVVIPDINFGKVVKQRKNIRKVVGLKPQHFATGYDRTETDVTSDVEGEQAEEEEDIQMEDVAPVSVKSEKKEKKERKEKKEKKEKKDKKSKKEKK